MENILRTSHSSNASVNHTDNTWRLEIPAGDSHSYRLAQLDDYAALSRHRFPHSPPWAFKLRARTSASDLPGTWGFGLWNDPFGLSIGFGRKAGRLPALPNTAWFFNASPPNYLSLRDDFSSSRGKAIPTRGFFAGTFRSPKITSLLLLPALLATPLLIFRPASRFLRRVAAKIIQQDSVVLNVDATGWHEYSIHWSQDYVRFDVDNNTVLRTTITPAPSLGLILWIDNQYAAWTPEGKIGFGLLKNPAAWLEISDLTILT